MKVAVVGVTGMVGQVICQLLESRNFPVDQLIPVASSRSVGKEISFKGQQLKVVSMQAAIDLQPDIAIFSAGGAASKAYAPKFAANGTRVIDNSSAFRMDTDKPLIVPEVNIHHLKETDMIIANPNCSTIQMVVALKPLQECYGLERLVISTYQSMTGTGVKAVRQYESELRGEAVEDAAYPHPIFANCLPHCDTFFDNGYTREELKLVHETRKIFESPELRITATAVRVPVQGGHSESINVELKEEFELADVRALLAGADGLVLLDNPAGNEYPMPLLAHQQDEVFVGRLRRDESQPRSLNMWVVADNLRKGAATNAIQIAEYMLSQGWLHSGQNLVKS